ncbi:MAG: TraB/GumN family protein [Bacteroidales bacterium]|nr:TraB/GumN family protein [Bacteroidales bacterium]MDD4822055.1 TraB/GumN family protein [Bacteroidales bacterium]
MKKLNVLFMLCLLGVLSCDFSSKEEELPDMQDALLWKISGNELPEPSYLFGSFNGIPGSFLDSVVGFKTAFKSVKQVMLASDSENADRSKNLGNTPSFDNAAMSDSSSLLMPADTTYQMLYNQDDYAFVDGELNSLLPGYSKRKPIVVAREYMMSIKALQQAVEGDNLLDHAIMEQAKGGTVKLIRLDALNVNLTTMEQTQVYVPTEVSSLKDQALGLLFFLKARPIYMNIKLRMDSMYRQQVPGELYLPINDGVDIIRRTLKEIPEFTMKQAYKDSAISQLNSYLGYKTDQKNDLWMKKILSAIKKQPTLISVGVLHLIGENGLINQLRQYGYTVEPVLSDGDQD